MTPRKELFIKIKKTLKLISELGLVDLDRKQLENQVKHYTACLIKTPTIKWESMVENKKEGVAEVEVTLYTKDRWLNQNNGANNSKHGLSEIDLIDKITEALEFLKGDYFKPLQLILEEKSQVSDKKIMSFRLVFSTMVYKRINYPYKNRKLTLKP